MASKRFELYRDQSDSTQRWRWRFVAKNGQNIFVSAESYRDRADAVKSIEIATGCSADPVHVIGVDGLPEFKADNFVGLKDYQRSRSTRNDKGKKRPSA